MAILIPWKPVVVIWLLLSAMLWCGCVASSLMEKKNPFAPYTIQEPRARRSVRSVRHQAYSANAGDGVRRESGVPAPERSAALLQN